MASGAVLAFFAFIGFEDIVNMAEETRNPARSLPLAILVALGVTTLIYALVTVAAVRVVPLADLADSRSPLALVWQAARGGDAAFLSSIAVFAALNGVLAQRGVPGCAYGRSSIFKTYIGAAAPRITRFDFSHVEEDTRILAAGPPHASQLRQSMLLNGVDLMRVAGFVSAAH